MLPWQDFVDAVRKKAWPLIGNMERKVNYDDQVAEVASYVPHRTEASISCASGMLSDILRFGLAQDNVEQSKFCNQS